MPTMNPHMKRAMDLAHQRGDHELIGELHLAVAAGNGGARVASAGNGGGRARSKRSGGSNDGPALSVTCPTCHADPGAQCHAPKGRTRGPHRARLQAASSAA